MTAILKNSRMPAIVDFGVFKYTINCQRNEAAHKSALGQFKEYISTAEGAYKCTDLFSKICREGVEVARLTKNHPLATTMQGPGAVFSRAAGAFVIPHAAFTAIEMKEASNKVASEGGSYGNMEKLIHTIFTCITSSCYALLQFIPGHTTLKSIATVTDLAGEGMGLRQQANLWSVADDLQKVTDLSPETHADLAQMKTQHLLGLIKSVVAVVGAIFAFLTMVFTAAVVPPIVSATIGLSAIALAIIQDFHAANMDNHLTLIREMG